MTTKLLKWYHNNKRDLPWRRTLDPYKIWVSEIILQQTQIKTGIKYYQKFLQKYPNVKALSSAKEIEVLKIWEGLGYYNRALNMLCSAKNVIINYNGVFPSRYDELINLKGVGDYTAAAISSICLNEKKAVLDGNVYRVLSRLYNINIPINSHVGKKRFQKIASDLLPKKNSGIYNQAIMDFGAIHCKKNNPKCNTCPFKKQCKSFKSDIVHLRPVKKTNKIYKCRHFNYLFIQNKNRFIIQQRTINDIWKKLYELPLIETKNKVEKDVLIKNSYFKQFKLLKITEKYNVTHKLSHQRLHISFWDICIKKNDINKGLKQIRLTDINKYPFPKPIQRYLHKEHLST